MNNSNRGFTLIQVVILMVGLAIAVSVALKVTQQGTTKARILKSIDTIQNIQKALYGDLSIKDQTDYGFIGDIGRLPSTLDELIYDNGDPNWSGPYLESDFVEDLSNPFLDAWGNEIVYDNLTGKLSLTSESIGDNIVDIPEPVEDISKILFGNIEGTLIDMFGNSIKTGDRQHILIYMEPIFDERNWPPIIQDIEREMRIFHMDRVWGKYHGVESWNALHIFCDKGDNGKDHWSDDWDWTEEDEDDDEEDDEDDEDDDKGKDEKEEEKFDPHFDDFWKDFVLQDEFTKDFLNIQVFIHPDKQGNYGLENIPVRPYIITAYHDKLELALKQYVVITPDESVHLNFRFDALFPGYKEPKDDKEKKDDDKSDKK